MRKFAVGYISFFDNELIIEIVCASDWKEAIFNHSKMKNIKWGEYFYEADLEEFKRRCFDLDMMIDVVFINN